MLNGDTVKTHSKLFDRLNDLTTEQRNPLTTDIDKRSIPEILKLINDEDKRIASAVEKEILYIAQATELVVNSFKKGGRGRPVPICR